MIKVVQGDRQTCQSFVEDLKSRVGQTSPEIEQSVREIIEAVRTGGDRAVKEFSKKFDGWTPESLELSRGELEAAVEECDPQFIASLRKAAENIRAFHQRQKQQSRIDPLPNGVITGQRVRGLHRVGVYVPGGTAGYPSSVLMNVIPAQVAQVGEIVMATPPGRTGRPDPNILAAAYVAGVDRVFLMGGAQAVAALALGTESVPQVDKIVGPGNIFVATAKKQLYGVVDIDMIAGPSEILIVADESASPKFLAADLMSQAEHDRMASAILITPSRELAGQTVEELYRQMEYLSRKDIIQESLDRFGGVIVCESMEEAVDFANELAPEHLEICVDNPFSYIGRLDNAGSVFLGHYSPEPLGDYFAGPNHVLPTGGTARFFSPLSVDDFIKKSSFIYYPKEELQKAAPDIIRLAQTEELTAHANSIQVRVEN
ncbi:MAG: histidinol dehydrogenase [Acutalibacter sp.]